MVSQLASGDLISDRYASALYDLAAEKNVVDPVLEDLKHIKKIIDHNKELFFLIKSPLISSNDKLEVLIKITSSLNFNELSITFLKLCIFLVIFCFFDAKFPEKVKSNTSVENHVC